MERRFFSSGPLFSGHNKAPSRALMGRTVPAPARAGGLDLLLDGVLEHLVLFRDMLTVIDYLERGTAVVENVALERIAAALIDSGTFAIGFVAEVETGRLGQKKFPMGVHQIMAVVLI